MLKDCYFGSFIIIIEVIIMSSDCVLHPLIFPSFSVLLSLSPFFQCILKVSSQSMKLSIDSATLFQLLLITHFLEIIISLLLHYHSYIIIDKFHFYFNHFKTFKWLSTSHSHNYSLTAPSPNVCAVLSRKIRSKPELLNFQSAWPAMSVINNKVSR